MEWAVGSMRLGLTVGVTARHEDPPSRVKRQTPRHSEVFAPSLRRKVRENYVVAETVDG
jgi:hypothetical protein